MLIETSGHIAGFQLSIAAFADYIYLLKMVEWNN